MIEVMVFIMYFIFHLIIIFHVIIMINVITVSIGYWDSSWGYGTDNLWSIGWTHYCLCLQLAGHFTHFTDCPSDNGDPDLTD